MLLTTAGSGSDSRRRLAATNSPPSKRFHPSLSTDGQTAIINNPASTSMPRAIPQPSSLIMPSLDSPPPLTAPTNGAVNGVNGVNGYSTDRPETPAGSMALTEYTMNFSTPSAEKRANIKKIVPDEYLLP